MGKQHAVGEPRMGEETAIEDNLRIWKIAEMTDPKHTKEVKLGRKLTAIDAYYQIKRATEAFGPWGQGWGYSLENSVLNVGEAPMAVVKMIFWYMDEDGARVDCSPVIAMNRLAMSNGADEEAFKKATTDALTKSLSYLGFSADVFMGLFDDNRYVEMTRKHFDKKRGEAEKAQESELKIPEAVKAAIDEAKKVKAQDAFTAIKERIRPEVERMTDKASIRYVALQFRKKEMELWPDMPDDTERKADVAA